MLWTTLVPGIVFCLAGFVAGEEDFEFIYWFPGSRKLASVDLDDYGYNDIRSEYIDNYIADYPELREEYEDYDPGHRAESVVLENAEKRSSGATVKDHPAALLGNYLTYTKLSLYTRNNKMQVIEASRWFNHFDHNKDLVIMVHGVPSDEYYVQDFFNTIAFALLQNADYNIIGVDWRYFISREKDIFDTEKNAQEAVKIGHVLNSVIVRALKSNYPMQVPKTCYIGHDMGSIPGVIQSVNYGFTFDSVYGLNQRPKLGSLDYLTLTQLHGRTVQTLSTLPYPYALSHRDYRPIYNEGFYYKGNYANLAYQILANAIIYGNMTAQYCSSEDDYIQGHCSELPKVPLWYRQTTSSCGHPIGRYFFEIPTKRPTSKCSGQTSTKG